MPFGRFHIITRTGMACAILVLGTVCSQLRGAGQYINDYIDYSASGLPGRLYVPPDAADSNSPLPLILALHGGGGIGNNNTSNVWDFDELLEQVREREAFIYAPQATSAYWHIDGRHQNIMAMIDRAIAERNIDPNRIYITGFSMGGGGTWDMLRLYPDRFAAAIPVCGIAPRTGSDYSEIACLPIWAFHARDDKNVSYTTSRNVIGGILRAKGLPSPSYLNTGTFLFNDPTLNLHYTEWPNGGHAIWPRVYSDSEAIDWLFDQKLSKTSATLTLLPSSIDGNQDTMTFKFISNLCGLFELQSSANLTQWYKEFEFTHTGDQTIIQIELDPNFYRVRVQE